MNVLTEEEKKAHDLGLLAQLPKPPVPSLEHTLSRYLDYAKTISGPADFIETEKYVEDFQENEGPQLQDRLVQIASEQENWCNSFWLKDMYLNNRLCLPVNSNPAYVFPKQNFQGPEDVIRYAAVLVAGVCDFKEKLDNRKLQVDKASGKLGGQAMCMDQYWRMFTSYRNARKETDVLETCLKPLQKGSEHIIVMFQNIPYVVQTVQSHKRLTTLELEFQLEQIINQESSFGPPIGILTSGERNKAAAAFEILLTDEQNCEYLKIVKASSFVLCLDKALGIQEPSVEVQGLHILHGSGVKHSAGNRWYEKTHQITPIFLDKKLAWWSESKVFFRHEYVPLGTDEVETRTISKSVQINPTAAKLLSKQFIVTEDGICGVNFEHSVAEGIALANLVEATISYMNDNLHKRYYKNDVKFLELNPEPLEFTVPAMLQPHIEDLENDIEGLILDTELKILVYDSFGKDLPKSKGFSPDSVIQMILQLCYYRCHKHLTSTYESASVRRFQKGRVDNIRAAHTAALAWVQIMEDTYSAENTKVEAFKAAVKKQSQVMQENVTGFGIDNHLVALRETAKSMAFDPKIFRDKVFAELFRFPLSTSQVPTTIKDTYVFYGPVTEDGYGCCYNPRPDHIVFAVTDRKASNKTNLTLFTNTLQTSLDDMKTFLEQNSF